MAANTCCVDLIGTCLRGLANVCLVTLERDEALTSLPSSVFTKQHLWRFVYSTEKYKEQECMSIKLHGCTISDCRNNRQLYLLPCLTSANFFW